MSIYSSLSFSLPFVTKPPEHGDTFWSPATFTLRNQQKVEACPRLFLCACEALRRPGSQRSGSQQTRVAGRTTCLSPPLQDVWVVDSPRPE
ncbi:hypothetical protein VZT92_018055 [Zoarces viviparus]|uniref:Uncharacterized protein n=1 Tax=Zoarces viviparus TaxID=48416 RepID=A0AAW1EPT1_ZOAVI